MKGRILFGLTTTALIALSIQPCIAAKKSRFFPHGCRQVGFQFYNQMLVLTREPETEPKSQLETIYLIYNKSHNDIVLQTNVNSRYLPSYKKTIPSMHWAAFSRNDDKINFHCNIPARYEGDIGYTVDCHEVLSLCNYNHAKFPPQNIGTYWLQKTMYNQRAMMKIAIRKGILLRW